MNCKTLNLTQDKLVDLLAETVKRTLLSEKRNINSEILYRMIQEKGKPILKGVDLHNLSDDDIIDVVNYRDIENPKSQNIIKFKDGTCILVRRTEKDKDYENKLDSRMNSASKDKHYQEKYDWINDEAEDLIFRNPYFREEWTKEHQRKAMDNALNKRRVRDGF